MKNLFLAISILCSSFFATNALAADICVKTALDPITGELICLDLPDVCVNVVVDPITGAVICLDLL